jgi:signal peptidase II
VKEMKHKWVLLISVALIGFLFDWYTKHLAETHLIYGMPKILIGDYLQFLLVYNKGAVFGLDPRHLFANFPTNQFFFVFNILAMILLLFYYRSIPKTERIMHWGIALILPGAIGNLFDRVLHAQKGVVDFIKVGLYPDLYWPIFNLADVYVSVGVVLLIFCFLTEDMRRKYAENKTVKIDVTGSNSRSLN